MSKHSSPPWTTRVATGTCDTLISSPDGLVATIRYETGTPERRAANARLIAAAPDLLACCKLWVAYFDRLTRDDEPGDPLVAERKRVHGSRVEATRAAIAKAEGTDAAQAGKE